MRAAVTAALILFKEPIIYTVPARPRPILVDVRAGEYVHSLMIEPSIKPIPLDDEGVRYRLYLYDPNHPITPKTLEKSALPYEYAPSTYMEINTSTDEFTLYDIGEHDLNNPVAGALGNGVSFTDPAAFALAFLSGRLSFLSGESAQALDTGFVLLLPVVREIVMVDEVGRLLITIKNSVVEYCDAACEYSTVLLGEESSYIVVRVPYSRVSYQASDGDDVLVLGKELHARLNTDGSATVFVDCEANTVKVAANERASLHGVFQMNDGDAYKAYAIDTEFENATLEMSAGNVIAPENVPIRFALETSEAEGVLQEESMTLEELNVEGIVGKVAYKIELTRNEEKTDSSVNGGSGHVLTAFYDESGSMLSIAETMSAQIPEGAVLARAFYVDQNNRPLCDYAELYLQEIGTELPLTANGELGELTWTLDDGLLTISGSREMLDPSSADYGAWLVYDKWIESVVIEEGITSIGEHAFADFASLTSVMIPVSVKTVSTSAFDNCSALTDIYYGGSVTGWNKVNVLSGNDSLTAAEIHYAKADVTFVSDNGSEDVTVQVIKGEKTKKITDPVKEDYAFLGWFVEEAEEAFDFENTEINEDISLTAHWIRTYKISYNANGGAGAPESQNKIHDVEITLSETIPNREHYDFLGWAACATATVAEYQPGGIFIADEETTLYALWQLKRYTITWLSDDDSVIDTTTVEYGVVPTHAEPVKAATAEYTYTFAGWSPEVTAVTGDISYTATFTGILNKYTIKFVNEDGTVLQTNEVAYGVMPTYTGQTPTKAATAQYTYAFKGWDKDIVAVAGAATYTAQFDSTVNKYAITWMDGDGKTLKTEDVAYGDTPAYSGQTPTKAATAQYTYSFNNTWSPAISAVTEAATYTAQFDSMVNKYMVTFEDEDGTELSSADYDYGTAASEIVKPADPTKAATAQYTYTFTGWSPTIAEVTADATYTATYSSTVNQYTVTFVDEDGTELSSADFDYGTTAADIVKPADPSKAATAQYTYTFAGWTPEVVAVTGEATYKATFTATKNSYTITWLNDDDSVIDTTTVEYGTIPTHADPTKAKTAQFTYTFAGWTPEITQVTADTTYKATYTSTVRKYMIKFVNDDGTVLQSKKVNYGTKPTYTGVTPTKAADEQYTYIFKAWTPSIVKVTKAATYKATYTAIPVFGTPSFRLPASTKTVGESAFEGLPMTIVEIPNGCEIIGKWAFKDCIGLRQIRIPASVTTIDTTAFDGCTDVFIYGTAGSAAEYFCDSHDSCTFVAENMSE